MAVKAAILPQGRRASRRGAGEPEAAITTSGQNAGLAGGWSSPGLWGAGVTKAVTVPG